MSNFPVKDEEIRALRVKVLKALAATAYPAQAIGSVASNNKLMVGDVKALVEGYGWPDPKAMAVHAQLLEADPQGTPAPKAAQPVVRRSDIATTTAIPAPSPHPGFTVDGLIALGEKSGKARTRRLAVKIREQVAELRGLINTETAEKEAAEKAAAEKERLRGEVAQLEAQLAEKRAQLTGKKKPAVTRTRDGKAKEIREWAAKHSVDCPAFGRIPRDVAEAYEAANR